jgi:hypothetical protein
MNEEELQPLFLTFEGGGFIGLPSLDLKGGGYFHRLGFPLGRLISPYVFQNVSKKAYNHTYNH